MKAEQLRKSILQLAIQGKLVPQDPADEPASVLLERIRAEKQRLIKEGKIKKDKGDSVIFKGDDNCYYEKTGKSDPICIDDEVGEIELPNGWILCRLSSVADIYTGNSINENEKQKNYTGLSSGYNYIGTKDVGFDHAINYQNGVKVPFEQTSFRIAHKNTPLLCIEGGSAGRKIGILQEDVCFGNKLCAFESFGVNPKYIYYYLQNPSFTQVFKEKTTGIIGGVSVNTLKSLLFLLPPLTEQERIVTEIEKFEPLIAEYDKLEQQATKLDGEIYDKLKKSILQYAIQGKLVPQDSNDEPAAILLERIRAEKKAQLGKKYVESYIYKGDDNCYYEHINGKDVDITQEIPYDLPDSWSYVRFNDITKIITCGYAATPHYVENGMPFLSAKNVKPYNFKPQNYKKISYDLYAKLTNKNKPEFNDILMTRVGAGIGEACIIDKQIDFAIYVSLTLIKLRDIVLSRFVLHWLNSPFGISTALKNIYGRDSSQGNLNVDNVRNYLFPLPPLNEQKRIVEKIDEIFVKL